MTDQKAPATLGVHHVGLSVRDLEKTAEFFTDVLGFKEVKRNPSYPSIFVTDGTNLITLWQVENPQEAEEFDRRKNVGLHHVAFKVENQAALDRMHEKLSNADGVTVEFSPRPLNTDSPVRHMMFYEPGGVRLEFIAIN